MTFRRILLWFLILLVVAAGIGYAFWPRPVLVDLVTAENGTLVVTVDGEGETRVKNVYILSAPVTGQALRIDAEVGDEVVANMTIVAKIEPIDPTILDARSKAQAEAAVDAAKAALALSKAELAQAEANLDFARGELGRARRLVKRQTISERAADEAERGFKTSRALVETAKAGLDVKLSELKRAKAQLITYSDAVAQRKSCDCISLHSPVNGRILRIFHESEGVVKAGEPLVEIGNPVDLEITVDLLSSDAVKVSAGLRVIIAGWGGEPPLAGRVRRVEPYGYKKVSALGIEEQRVNVIIDLTDAYQKWSRLGHGYQVEARIVLWEGTDVLRLPLTSLFRDGQRWAVFVETAGMAEKRFVELGQRNELHAEITQGLEKGERVVLHPGGRIEDGARIAPRG